MGASDRQLETTLALDKDGGIVEGLSGAASKFSNENYGKVVQRLNLEDFFDFEYNDLGLTKGQEKKKIYTVSWMCMIRYS